MINQNQHTYQDAKVYLCNFREDVISLLRSFRFAFFFICWNENGGGRFEGLEKTDCLFWRFVH
jgi:hypothetical protein